MASIDKIYGTNQQYSEFYSWCKKNAEGMLKFFYEMDDYTSRIRPITNTPIYVDVWLWKNCTLSFVREQLFKMYNGIPKIKRSSVFFIEKIIPFIYSKIYDNGFKYFVKPNDKTLYVIYHDKYFETPLTIDDVSEG